MYSGYSQFVQDTSLVWLNHNLVRQDDCRSVQLCHGDFVRIALPPPLTVLRNVPTRCIARLLQVGVHADDLEAFYWISDVDQAQPRQHHREDDLSERCHFDSSADLQWPRLATPFVPLNNDFTADLLQRWHLFVQLGPGAVEPCIVVKTWYNDHDRWPICDTPRDVSLFADSPNWRADILRAWPDRLDPFVETEIYMVDPDPTDEVEHVVGHLILVQRSHADRRSILVSVLDNTIWNGHPRRWALRSSRDPSGAELVALMGYRFYCPPHMPHNQCQIWCRQQEIGMDDDLIVRHGLAITLTVLRHELEEDSDTQISFPADPDEHGVASLFQDPAIACQPSSLQSHVRQHSSDFAHGAPPNEQLPMSHQRSSHSARPPDQWLLPVGMSFLQHAHTVDDEGHAEVEWMTWYLCAHTRRSSEESRRIQFDTEQHMWLQDLQQLWRDQWIPHLDAQIYVIEPMPPKATYERHVGGLLIAQGEVPQHVPVLVTTIFASTLGRRLSHMACFLPQPCLPSQLFQMLRIERICHDRACCVEIAGQEVPMQGLAHAAAGDNVRVHVSARTHPGVSLLQTKAQRRFAFNPDAPVFEPTSHHPWERLTTDAVAHAQWPQVVQQTERSDSDVQHLCLNDLIPAPTIVQLDFHPVIALRDTILHLDLGNIHPRASIVKWHPSTQGAFDAIPDWQGELPTGVSFFTDGSAAWTQDERCASAAIIRIVHTAQGDRFGGFRCFTTLADGHAPYAEAAAIFAATLWTVQMCEAFPTSSTWLIQFHFDCMFAGMAAKAWWSVRAHAQLPQFTRSLVHWLEARYAIHIGWYHVPAHTGHPWNEAADAAAWAAVSQWIPCDDIAVLLHQLGGEHSMMAWLWLLEHAEHGHPAFPAVHRGIMNVNVSMVLQSQPTPDDHPFQACREHQPAASHEISFTLTCATANVLTLYQNKAEHGKGLTARLEALLRSFEHENILVIGVQETRSQMQGHTICHDFHVLAASATPKGVGGVQLWIKRKWKTSQGTITISTADLRIVAAEPQFLLVKLMHDGLRLLFLVGHAPNCPTFETATTFWNNISRSIPASLRSWSLIGLLDANARVGSMQSKAIGFCGEEPENLAGECFHQWLHDQNLFLPQTFDAYHRGDHTTWTHSSGATARLDFVALDQNLRQDGIQTCISNVDLTLHHEDHRSIQVAIPIQCRVKQFSTDSHLFSFNMCSSSYSLAL